MRFQEMFFSRFENRPFKHNPDSRQQCRKNGKTPNRKAEKKIISAYSSLHWCNFIQPPYREDTS